MCDVALLDGKHLAALLTLGMVVPDPLDQNGSIHVRNFVGPHYIEMLIRTEKPYIAGERCTLLPLLTLTFRCHTLNPPF